MHRKEKGEKMKETKKKKSEVKDRRRCEGKVVMEKTEMAREADRKV